jgi:hypothetical protein
MVERTHFEAVRTVQVTISHSRVDLTDWEMVCGPCGHGHTLQQQAADTLGELGRTKKVSVGLVDAAKQISRHLQIYLVGSPCKRRSPGCMRTCGLTGSSSLPLDMLECTCFVWLAIVT